MIDDQRNIKEIKTTEDDNYQCEEKEAEGAQGSKGMEQKEITQEDTK